MEGEDDKVAQIVAITDTDPNTARHLLEASAGNVEAAVQLHFDGGNAFDDANEALVRELATADLPPEPAAVSGAQAGADPMDDGTRRPDEVVRERLYDGPMHGGRFGMPGMPGGMPGAGMPGGVPHYNPRMPPAQVDMPFRNFREEAEDMDEGGPGLDDLYRAPTELMNNQALTMLKGEAEAEDKWLLINVQSNAEFASHQLNADLWGQPMIKEIVKGNFVFAQRTLPNAEAQQVVSTYDMRDLPAVVIIDPHTGQKMMQWTGLIQPDRFMEDVLPFLDMSPSNPQAGTLMGSALQHATFQKTTAPAIGKAGVSGVSDEDEAMHNAIAESLATGGAALPGTGGAASASGRHGAVTIDDEEDDEDAMFAAALEASRREAAAAAGAATGSAAAGSAELRSPAAAGNASSSAATPSHAATGAPTNGAASGAAGGAGGGAANALLVQPSAPPAESAASVQEAARARVPPEPTAGTAGACRVAIRSPKGERYQRQFAGSDTVRALVDFVMASVPEEDAARPFSLSPAGPGSAPLADMDATLESAHLSGVMLVMKWV